MQRWRRLLREPLLQFCLGGLVLFGLWRVVAPAGGRRVRVTAAVRDGLAADHARRTGAPPAKDELDRLVERWLEQEVLYREALALGLDRGDVIVRRRLVQKMQFVLEGLEPVTEPDDAALQAWLDDHAARYATGPRVSFEHVFVSRDRHGASGALAAELARQLAAGVDPARLGDPFIGGRSLRDEDARSLGARFGAPFAEAVVKLPKGEWSAPIASSFGLHLVRVSAVDATPPSLSRVRTAVRQDLLAELRARRDRAALARLRARWTVEDGR